MSKKNIAIVAHDQKKKTLLNWIDVHYERLKKHHFIASGTTGTLVKKQFPDLKVDVMLSGPLGGDQQIGAMIATGDIDLMIFLTDPMTAQPHDVDVKALTRLAVVYNTPMALNRASADFMISSDLLDQEYEADDNDYSDYLNRFDRENKSS